jgi:hypothetical protein
MIISCPECNKDVSDKAVSCPNCGYPISQINTQNNKVVDTGYPDLIGDLSLGKQIVSWFGDAAITGYFDNRENVTDNIPTGKMHVLLCENGIRLCGSFYKPIMDLHFKQVISLKETTQQELSATDKSVIGRGIVGGLILGPIGAIVGGMSGIGTKTKVKDKKYLIINYWSKTTKQPASLLIGCEIKATPFIKRFEKEKNKQ